MLSLRYRPWKVSGLLGPVYPPLPLGAPPRPLPLPLPLSSCRGWCDPNARCHQLDPGKMTHLDTPIERLSTI